MKPLSFFCFLFGSIFLFSQVKEKTEYAYLKRETDTERYFKAEVAGMPVTIFLKQGEILDCSQEEYFVTGWYFYDKYQKKIPLSGIFRYGDITVYNLGINHEEKFKIYASNLPSELRFKLDSIEKKLNFVEKIEFLTDDYLEKRTKNYSGEMKYKGKTFKATLFTKDNSIYRENEYLIFPNGQTYNTYDLIGKYLGNQLLSFHQGKTENRIILAYQHLGNLNACGRCGADEEKGYRVLSFNKNYKFKGMNEVPVYSCNLNLMDSYKLTSDDPKILKFSVGNDFENIRYNVTVNLNNSTISKFN